MANKYATLVCLGALALASSCQSNGTRQNGGQPDGAGSPLVLYPGSPEGHTARLQGTLEMNGGCLYIANEGGERWLAAFPSPGTSWDPENRSVRMGDKVLRVGATSGFAGGEISNGPGAIQWVQAPGNGCDGSKIWLVNALVDS